MPYYKYGRVRDSHDDYGTSKTITRYSHIPHTSSVTYSLGNKISSVLDTSHPNWAIRLALLPFMNDPCYITSVETLYPDGCKATYSYRYYTLYREGNLHAHHGHQFQPIPVLTKDGIVSDAKLNAISRMNTAPRAMLEDVFEIKEIARFLKKPMLTLSTLSHSFKKRRKYLQRKKRLNRKRALANAWLEYRFAVMPLVLSVSNIIESIGLGYVYHEDLRSSRSRESDYELNEGSMVYYNSTYDSYTRREIEAQATLYYTITNPVGGFRENFGFRARDVPVTLWNIVPLSFVVDRFFDISSAIEAGTNLADPSVKIVAGFISDKDNTIQSSALTGWTNSQVSDFSIDRSAPDYIVKSGHYYREKWVPTVSDIVPRVKPLGLVDTLTKMIDNFALVTQNFR